jgi:hypothetical protein
MGSVVGALPRGGGTSGRPSPRERMRVQVRPLRARGKRSARSDQVPHPAVREHGLAAQRIRGGCLPSRPYSSDSRTLAACEPPPEHRGRRDPTSHRPRDSKSPNRDISSLQIGPPEARICFANRPGFPSCRALTLPGAYPSCGAQSPFLAPALGVSFPHRKPRS